MRILDWVKEKIRRVPSAPRYYWEKLINHRKQSADQNDDKFAHRTQVFVKAVSEGQSTGAAKQFFQNSAQYRRQYWNQLARIDHQIAILGRSGWADQEFLASGRFILDWIHEYQLCNPNSVVLDLGCGTGRVAYHVAPLVKFLYGVDVSDEMITRARKNLSHLNNVKMQCIDGESLTDFEDASIDLLYSTLVLQHMERHQCYRMFGEIARVVRPGGQVLIQLPWSGSKIYASAYDQEPEKHDLWYARMYSKDEFRNLLMTNEFSVVYLGVIEDNLWGVAIRNQR